MVTTAPVDKVKATKSSNHIIEYRKQHFTISGDGDPIIKFDEVLVHPTRLSHPESQVCHTENA